MFLLDWKENCVIDAANRTLTSVKGAEVEK